MMKKDRIFKTKPFYSPRPWGYEQWTLSTHRHGQSLVLPGKENLLTYLGHPLPILIKIIKAADALSVQVHPGDEYARKHEHDLGKTECWYILEAEEGAKLIAGIHPGVNRAQMEQALSEGKLEDVLEYIPVKPGDMIFIPHGTVHAILGGIKLFEIQESSDSTYRMYDWGRDREMHIQKALDVIDYSGQNGAGKIENFTRLETPYFRVEKVVLEDEEMTLTADQGFETINVCHGSGTIHTPDQDLDLDPDSTVYIPQGVTCTIKGSVEFLRTW